MRTALAIAVALWAMAAPGFAGTLGLVTGASSTFPDWTWSVTVAEAAGEITVITGPINGPHAPFLWTDEVSLGPGRQESGPLTSQPTDQGPNAYRVELEVPRYCPCRVEFRDEEGRVLATWGYLTYALPGF